VNTEDKAALLQAPVGDVVEIPSLVRNVLAQMKIVLVSDFLVLTKEALEEQEGVGRKKVKVILELLEQLRVCVGIEEVREPVVKKSLARELMVRGVVLSTPWTILSSRLSNRAKNVFTEAQFKTLHDVVSFLDARTSVDNFGSKTRKEVVALLEEVAQHGLSDSSFGEVSFSDIPSFLAAVFAAIAPEEQTLLQERFLDQKTLEQLAQSRGITREGIRIRLEKLLRRIRERFNTAAQDLLSELKNTLVSSPDLLHQEEIWSLIPGIDLPKLVLVFEISSEANSCRIYKDEFLTSRDAGVLDPRVASFWRSLREREEGALPFDEILEAAQDCNFRVHPLSLRRLLERVYERQSLPDGRMIISKESVGSAISELLRAAARPLHLDEIGMALIPAQGQDGIEITDSYVRKAISRRDDVYYVDRGTYCHITAMGISPEELQRAVEQSVLLIRGKTQAISTKFLVDELKSRGISHQALTPHLLKNAMARHPEVVSMRKYLVGHIDSLQEEGMTLKNRLEAILLAAKEPISIETMKSLLPKETEYHTISIGEALGSAGFVLCVSWGKYVHINALQLGVDAQQRLISNALLHLSEDGSPASGLELLTRLKEQGLDEGLEARPDGPSLLLGLLRTSEQVISLSGQLISRNTSKAQIAFEEAIVLLLEVEGPKTRQSIEASLAGKYHPVTLSWYLKLTLQRMLREKKLHCSADDRYQPKD
jgi:hypothetical protein